MGIGPSSGLHSRRTVSKALRRSRSRLLIFEGKLARSTRKGHFVRSARSSSSPPACRESLQSGPLTQKSYNWTVLAQTRVRLKHAALRGVHFQDCARSLCQGSKLQPLPPRGHTFSKGDANPCVRPRLFRLSWTHVLCQICSKSLS